MSRLQTGILLDFQATALAILSGTASGTTPIVGPWVKIDSVDSLDVTFVTGSTTNVTWSVLFSATANGAQPFAPSTTPAYPTGTNQNSSVNIAIGNDIAKYVQVTATPSAGSQAVSATPTMVYGKPAIIPHTKDTGVVFDCPASATLAGQVTLEYSANYNPGNRDLGVGTLPKNTVADPAIWFPATDVTDTPYVIPALVASTGQTIALRLGRLEFIAMRARFAPSAGFGRYRGVYNSKA